MIISKLKKEDYQGKKFIARLLSEKMTAKQMNMWQMKFLVSRQKYSILQELQE